MEVKVNSFDQLPTAISKLSESVSYAVRLLEQIKANGNIAATEPDKPLTINEAASFLTLAVPTVYSLVSRGEIPCQKRGKRLYFLRSELMEWVKLGRRKTNAEARAEADNYFTNRKPRQ